MIPLISIIIPTYNRAHLIRETLDSIIAQTYKNWECIVVDDGSTDDTENVIREYIKRDSRFRFYRRPANRSKGGNAARNYGFELSNGEFVNWFDSDDLMSESLLEKKMDVFSYKPNLEFVICGFKMFHKDKIIENNKWVIANKENIYKKYLTREVVLNTPVILWKKDRIKDITFDEKLTRAQDLYFIFRAFENLSLSFEILPLPLVSVRIHEETITSSYKLGLINDIKSEIKVRKSIFLNFVNEDDLEFKKKIRNIYLDTLKQSLITRNYSVFFKEILIVKGLHFILKVKLLFVGVLYLLFKKGLSLYSKVLKTSR